MWFTSANSCTTRSLVDARGYFVLICVVATLATGCDRDPVKVLPSVAARPVRVLLFDSEEGLRVQVAGGVRIADAAGEPFELGHLNWTTLTAGSVHQRLGDRDVTLPLRLTPMEGAAMLISKQKNGSFASAGQYDGTVAISLEDKGRTRVINEVDVESYVAGVVPYEVVSHFHDAALEAQAVAARGYVLYAMSSNANRSYDVRASEGDQVYGGISHADIGRRSRRAVNSTHGLVLAEDTPNGDRIFSPFYSSACGGGTQSLSVVQPGRVPEPLRGGVLCDYCKIAPKGAYRWGPTKISRADFLARLKRRFSETRKWKSIASLEVIRDDQTKRVARVIITSASGDTLRLGGERFRLAVGGRIMRSTDCTITLKKKVIAFQDGKGFGHGVGLCQWGAEGQARKGATAGDILAFYYPDSRLVRAY